MFFFERDVSGRLIDASRKHLPDVTGEPSLLAYLKQSQHRLRNLVLAMVRRGDFDTAIRKLTDLLLVVGSDHRYNFSLNSSKRAQLGIDSLLVLLEAIVACFSQRMIQLGLLDESLSDNLEDKLQLLYSVYVWAPVTTVPPLDKRVAADLLGFIIRVMPRSVQNVPLSVLLSRHLETRLSDIMLTVAQYIYMSNPQLILDEMYRALAEWDAPARVDLMLLYPSSTDNFIRYLKMGQSFLPRLDSSDQHELLKMMCISMMRAMVAKPTCCWATGPASLTAVAGFTSAVERSRPFRALRGFRCYEALMLTLLEIIKMANLIYQPQTTTAISPPPGPAYSSATTSASAAAAASVASASAACTAAAAAAAAAASAANSPHQHWDTTSEEEISLSRTNSGNTTNGAGNGTVPLAASITASTATSTNNGNSLKLTHSRNHKDVKPTVISVAHFKLMERATSLVKRDNAADKRAASRHAAMEYLTCIGFLGNLASRRPEGRPFHGLTLDVLPYTNIIVEDVKVLPDQQQMMFAFYCSQVAPAEIEGLRKKLDPTLLFQTLRIMDLVAEEFSMSTICGRGLIDGFLHMALENRDYEAVHTTMSLLIKAPANQLSLSIVRDTLAHFIVYLTKYQNLELNGRRILQCYITILVSRIGLDSCIDTLLPLIPSEGPVEILFHPDKLHSLYQMLSLLAHGRRVVPSEYVEGVGTLSRRLKTLRTALMLCLCSDTNEAIETALKCLELLQSDPKQSSAERSLISELLDSMDQALPSTNVMQKRMAASLAVDSGPSFLPLNEAVREALEVAKERHVSHKLRVNLLRLRIATFTLEPQETRVASYAEFLNLEGTLLQSISGSVPLNSSLATEFFLTTSPIHGEHRGRTGPLNGPQLSGKIQLYTWLLNCLETDHPISASELRLGEICARAVSNLTPHSEVAHECMVLKFVEAAAKYATKDDDQQKASAIFAAAVDLILARPWCEGAADSLSTALASVFSYHPEPDSIRLKALVEKVLQLNLSSVQIAVLTPLLSENLDKVAPLYYGASSQNDVYRASFYEALTRRYSSKTSQTSLEWQSGDLVAFLLENKPVLRALGDVCSINGDDKLSSALLQLFSSHSKAAERKLIQISIHHEVQCSSCPSELFRSNSVTMKIILEWLRTFSSSYLNAVLSPALVTLRSASVIDDADNESLFVDVMSRFKSRAVPLQLQWLLCMVKEAVLAKYNAEAARQALSVLMVMRFICPAVVAPHRYGVARRPPARHFAQILRKFAIYLQSRGEQVCDLMVYTDDENNAPAGTACASAANAANGASANGTAAATGSGAATSPTAAHAGINMMTCKAGAHGSQCKFAADFESLFSETDQDQVQKKNADNEEQFISATRQVYHFLRRHSVEVRVVLLSHGEGEIVARLLRYFRIGRNSNYLANTLAATSLEEDDNGNADGVGSSTSDSLQRSRFRNTTVIAMPARAICSQESISKAAVKRVAELEYPALLDLTDFSGLFDRWAEFMLYMAYSYVIKTSRRYEFIIINCPGRTKSMMLRLQGLLTLMVNIKFFTSLDISNVDDVPAHLVDAREAVADIKGSVKFPVQIRSGPTVSSHEADLFIGEKFLQIVGDGSCDVIPYVSKNRYGELVVRLTKDELQLSVQGFEIVILSPTSSLLRVLELSLAAAEAAKAGAIIDLRNESSTTGVPYRLGPLLANGTFQRTDENADILSRKPKSHDAKHEELQYFRGDNAQSNGVCPGSLLFSTLYDSMHTSSDVRRRAVELYAVLPESLNLQLSIPSPQKILMPNQVFSLAASAARRHPDLALCVASSLALLGTRITEKAAQVVSPWVPHLVCECPTKVRMLRERVLRPLIQAVADAPDTVGPVLLEHFWPRMRDLPVLICDILLEVSMTASPESIEALREIVASGTPADRPHESREFAEALLARLHSCLRANGDPSATKWSKHPDWKEINVCAILFSSVTVDWKTAELLFPEICFLLFVLSGVGTPQLRNALHQLFINYLNAFLQSPNCLPGQRQRLQETRTELTSPRGSVLFGVQKDIHGSDPDWIIDDYNDYTPEMTEYLGRLLSDASVAVFSNRLSGFQETRVAVATRVMEFVGVVWPPLQRRCVLALVGAVRFLMPDTVVHDLITHLTTILQEDKEETLETRGVLVATFLRMFSETIECIPDTGVYHHYLFWLSVVALASGSVAIQADAVRLLRESVKIGHFRGSFREKSLPEVYLSVIPSWSDNVSGSSTSGTGAGTGAGTGTSTNSNTPNGFLFGSESSPFPLDIPTTEANFHMALAQLLVLPLQQAESQSLALECCDVLATACPSEFVYAALLYLGGEEGRIATRVPTGAFVEADDTVAQWLATKVRSTDSSTMLTLALCAEISGYSRSMNFYQTGPRLLDLMLAIKDRAAVNMISPLLRPIFLRLLKLDDKRTEIGLNCWSLYIFSYSPEERKNIERNGCTLLNFVRSLGLRPWFDESYNTHPLFYEEKFTETTRMALSKRWIRSEESQKVLEAEKPF